MDTDSTTSSPLAPLGALAAVAALVALFAALVAWRGVLTALAILLVTTAAAVAAVAGTRHAVDRHDAAATGPAPAARTMLRGRHRPEAVAARRRHVPADTPAVVSCSR